MSAALPWPPTSSGDGRTARQSKQPRLPIRQKLWKITPMGQISRAYNSAAMNNRHRAIHVSVVLTVAVSCVLGGIAIPSGANATAVDAWLASHACCHQDGVQNCCGMACCRTPASVPDRVPLDQPERFDLRLQGRKLPWSGTTPSVPKVTDAAERHGISLAVPTSGSPSLITQHICLQV